MTVLTPLRLEPNVLELFYRGGERIAELRSYAGPRGPEEWLGSVVARWGSDRPGLTDLGPAGLLRDLVAADPEGWLGAAHVARWGSSPALLVKLLDAGERLPVHLHPNRSFAASHLGCPFGKTEAWVVLDVPAGGGTVYIGTTRPVAREEWAELVEAQAAEQMLDLLNPLTVNAGDAVLVPSSTPHSIGAGIFVVELQEPTDFSILLEWEGFDIDGAVNGHLGLGFDVALDAVRRDAVGGDELDGLIRRLADDDRVDAPRPALPAVAEPYFRAWAVDGSDTAVTVSAAFSVVVVTGGAGTMQWADGSEPLARGDALVVPHGAGPLTFTPGVTAVVSQPPAPDAPEPDERGPR